MPQCSYWTDASLSATSLSDDPQAWVNTSYLYRRGLLLISSDGVPVGHPVTFPLDIESKVRSDFRDIEAVYVAPDGTWSVVGQVLSRVAGVLTIEFPLADVLVGNIPSSGNYYIYYGNLSLANPIVRGNYVTNPWPVAVGHDGVGVSYSRPGEHWVGGVSNQINANVNFVFYGTQLQYVANVGPDQGILSVQLDGGSAVDVDLYRPVANAQVVYEIDGLSSALHVFVGKVTGRHSAGSSSSLVNVVGFNISKFITVTDLGEEIKALPWHVSVGGS